MISPLNSRTRILIKNEICVNKIDWELRARNFEKMLYYLTFKAYEEFLKHDHKKLNLKETLEYGFDKKFLTYQGKNLFVKNLPEIRDEFIKSLNFEKNLEISPAIFMEESFLKTLRPIDRALIRRMNEMEKLYSMDKRPLLDIKKRFKGANPIFQGQSRVASKVIKDKKSHEEGDLELREMLLQKVLPLYPCF